jgi:uncharacterized RDD family membrane protein YckC
VRTPESIAFSYELAGLGSRFLAVAIDLVIQILIAIAIGFAFSLAAQRSGDVAKTAHVPSAQLTSLVIAILILVIFLIFDGYFIIFEALWNGQTPGKRLLGIRVVRDGGYPIDLGSSVLRNLIRVVEAIFIYVPAAVCALLSPQNKRIGDYAAGTIVVRDRAFEVSHPDTWLQGDTAPQLAPLVAAEALTPEEWTVVDRYVERRTSLPPGVAADSAARIARALRPKVGDAGASLTDDDLLLRLSASRRR